MKIVVDQKQHRKVGSHEGGVRSGWQAQSWAVTRTSVPFFNNRDEEYRGKRLPYC
jgi:hypothetical protein